VYITLGNLPEHARNRVEGKKLLGFIPTVKIPSSVSEEKVKKYKRYIHNASLEIMLKPIVEKQSGFVMKIFHSEVRKYIKRH